MSELAAAQPQPHRLDVRFTGSGSEYFRIWIVNLLLTLVTLGLYYPWAKVRRLRYFYGNTLVDGQPLDFHGSPKAILRGYLLVGLMGLLYSVAGGFSPVAGFIAFLILAAVWPTLLKSSMQFRLANTSWRGLRFRFNGSVRGAYRALLPLFVPGLIIVAAVLGVPDRRHPPPWYGIVFLLVMLGLLLCGPWLWWNLKKYQHDHYAIGQLQTELKATRASFYGVFLKTVGIFLLAGLVVLGLFISASRLGLAGAENEARLGVILMVLGLLGAQLLPRSYFISRMQNLLWSRTGNTSLRFRSELKLSPLLSLTVKNWLLMLLTLGVYWPFAAVASTRMRLEAVSVSTRVHPDALVDELRARHADATGDAAGDFLGFDIGL